MPLMDMKKPQTEIQIVDAPPKKTRPLLITLVCIMGFLSTALGMGVIILFPHSIDELVRLYGLKLPIGSIIINIFTLIAFVGIWRMQYWGFVLYSLAYIAGAFHAYMTGYEILWAYLPGLVVIISSMIYIRKFSI